MRKKAVDVYMLVCVREFYKSAQQSADCVYIWGVGLKSLKMGRRQTMYCKIFEKPNKKSVRN